jgi:hypothetical protein
MYVVYLMNCKLSSLRSGQAKLHAGGFERIPMRALVLERLDQVGQKRLIHHEVQATSGKLKFKV